MQESKRCYQNDIRGKNCSSAEELDGPTAKKPRGQPPDIEILQAIFIVPHTYQNKVRFFRSLKAFKPFKKGFDIGAYQYCEVSVIW